MTTLEELKKLIQEKFDIAAETLQAEAPLADYGLDSLSLAELLFTVEEHFHLDIPDSRPDINNLLGLAELIDGLRSRQAA